MTEFTKGIFEVSRDVYKNNKGSILRTIVYTIGHFAIAITVLMLVADVSFMIALTDAIVEPIANSVWYFVLDKWWASKSKKFKLGRVRLLLKEPRSTLSWHKDPECRLHVPIITNPGCSMVIENVAKHLPADGRVWITNNTKYHNFFNGGEQARIHLVACVLDSPFK